MFKTISFLLICFFAAAKPSIADSSQDLRKAFYESVLKSDKVPFFLKKVESISDPSPLEEAYIGASKALQARESWNPIEKIILIQNCRKLLKKALLRDNLNIEIRFLRFSIEHNIPELFRSTKSVSEDKSIIIRELSTIHRFQIEKNFANYILQFFEDTQSCSKEEIEMIRMKVS